MDITAEDIYMQLYVSAGFYLPIAIITHRFKAATSIQFCEMLH